MVIYQLRSRSKDVRCVWPCFRGKRAGCRARERVNRCRYSTEVQLTNHINHSRSSRPHQNKATFYLLHQLRMFLQWYSVTKRCYFFLKLLTNTDFFNLATTAPKKRFVCKRTGIAKNKFSLTSASAKTKLFFSVLPNRMKRFTVNYLSLS